MFLVTHMLLFQTYVKILITLVLLKMMFLVAQRRGLRPNGVPYERFVFLIVAVTLGPFDNMIIRCLQDCWAGWLCLCFLGVDNKHIHWGVPWGRGGVQEIFRQTYPDYVFEIEEIPWELSGFFYFHLIFTYRNSNYVYNMYFLHLSYNLIFLIRNIFSYKNKEVYNKMYLWKNVLVHIK